MLNFGICASIVSALIAGNISTAPAPTVWSGSNLRVEHAVEVVGQDNGLCYLQTDNGNVWGVYGALDASRLYCVVFDDNNTDSIEDDSILLAVAMD